jgi:hypothetical protein
MVGKIISKIEADEQFGPVIESVEMNAKDLLAIVEKAQKFVMFRVVDGKVTILDEARKVISPLSAVVSAQDVFKYYSKEIVLEIINTAADSVLTIENRKDKLTITNGANTLEWAQDCPPFCP